MTAADLAQWCASCVTSHPVLTGLGSLTGATAVLGMLGGMTGLFPPPPPAPELSTGVEIPIAQGTGYNATVDSMHGYAGQHGFHADGTLASAHGQAGPVGITGNLADGSVEVENDRGGYYGAGAEAGVGDVSVNYGDAGGNPTEGHDLHIRGGGSLSVGGAVRGYIGTDVDGDGLPEYGIGVDAGPFTGDIRYEPGATPSGQGLTDVAHAPPPAPSGMVPMAGQAPPEPGGIVGPDGNLNIPPPPAPPYVAPAADLPSSPSSPSSATPPAPAPQPLPQELVPNPARIDSPPQPGPAPTAPTSTPHDAPLAATGTSVPGPGGTTITNADGRIVVTSPDGVPTTAVPTGGGGYQAGLSNGNLLTMRPDGSASIQLPDGSTQNWDAHGRFAGTNPPSATYADQGANVNTPPVAQDVRVPMTGGGFRVDHPDGSSDVHWPNGAIVHVEPDQQHWHQVRGPI
jgi:hypothetical protein